MKNLIIEDTKRKIDEIKENEMNGVDAGELQKKIKEIEWNQVRLGMIILG